MFDILPHRRTIAGTYSTTGFMWCPYMHLFRKLHFSMNKSFETYQTIDEVVHSRLWRSPEPSARALCPRLVPAPWASRLVPAPCACALCLRLEPGLNGSAGDCLIGSCFNGPWFCPGLNNKYATGAVTSRRSVVNMLKDLKWIDGRDGRGQSTTSLISRKKKHIQLAVALSQID